jgi:purine nucleosidase
MIADRPDDGMLTARLAPPDGPVRMVLDTDTDNELDDQFALTYALLSPERLQVEAVYAAPYHNARSTGPADGMHRSRAEIDRIVARLDDRLAGRTRPEVFDGATGWLTGAEAAAVELAANPAVADLVARALATDPAGPPLYVVAIGAPTNVAVALRAEPAITDRIVVVWLGGNPTWWPSAREFNLMQDPDASALLFDSGVPLVHVPCVNVTEHLKTTRAEIDRYVRPAGPIGAYLADIYADQIPDLPAVSKEVWDLGPVAWLVDPGWTESELRPSPVLVQHGDDFGWRDEPGRHPIREIRRIHRDFVFADLFGKLAG